MDSANETAPQTMARYDTEFYDPIVHDYANFGTWTERGAEDINARATRYWQDVLERDERPDVDGDKLAALQEFIARRTQDGGAPPES